VSEEDWKTDLKHPDEIKFNNVWLGHWPAGDAQYVIPPGGNPPVHGYVVDEGCPVVAWLPESEVYRWRQELREKRGGAPGAHRRVLTVASALEWRAFYYIDRPFVLPESAGRRAYLVALPVSQKDHQRAYDACVRAQLIPDKALWWWSPHVFVEIAHALGLGICTQSRDLVLGRHARGLLDAGKMLVDPGANG
jgi:hypothetical protein